MGTGRKLLLLILTPLFSLLLFALAINYGLSKTIGDSGSVKKILRESGIYGSVVPNILKQSGNINTAIGEVSAMDPLVKSAASKSLPPQRVQEYSENAINNLYAWLDGDISEPNFNIDLSDSKSSFTNNLASEIELKLSSLPACKTAYTASGFDVLSATCLPPGDSASSAANLLRIETNNSSGFLNQAGVKASDIKGNDPEKTIFQDQLKDLPATFQWFRKSPLILTVLTLLTGLIMVFLRPTLSNGLRHIGASLLTVGIALLIFAWIFNYAINSRVIPKINIENISMQQSIRRAFGDLSKQTTANYYLFGGFYSLLGIAGLANPLLLSRRGHSESEEEVTTSSETLEPTTPKISKKS